MLVECVVSSGTPLLALIQDIVTTMKKVKVGGVVSESTLIIKAKEAVLKGCNNEV